MDYNGGAEEDIQKRKSRLDLLSPENHAETYTASQSIVRLYVAGSLVFRG